MANAQDLLDELLELRERGIDLRESEVYMDSYYGPMFWRGEIKVDREGDTQLCTE